MKRVLIHRHLVYVAVYVLFACASMANDAIK